MSVNQLEQVPSESSKSRTSEEKENGNNSQLLAIVDVENTPFKVVMDNENNVCFLTLGRFKVSPEFPNYDDAIRYINDRMWELLVNVVCVLHESIINVVGEEMASKK